jgi:hypothetical protein
MSARKKTTSKTSYYLISMDQEPQDDRGSESVLGKVRGNAVGSQYLITDGGLAPDKAVAEATVRQHRLYGWNQRANPPASGYSEVGGRPWQSAQPTDLNYWRLLSVL